MFESRKQLSSAHALACAYGHEWARLPLAALDAALSHHVQPAEVDAEDHAGAARARLREGRPSVWAPAGVAPSPEHTTGTGRLRWRVRATGDVEAVVYRPDPAAASPCGTAVLEALFAPTGRVLTARTRGTRAVRCEVRHVEAIAEVARALGATEGATRAVVAAAADDRLTAMVAAHEEATEEAETAYYAATDALGDEKWAALHALDALLAVGDTLTPAQTAQRASLYAEATAATAVGQAAREQTYVRVYEAAFAQRLAALQAARAASLEAEERRYQAARREALETRRRLGPLT